MCSRHLRRRVLWRCPTVLTLHRFFFATVPLSLCPAISPLQDCSPSFALTLSSLRLQQSTRVAVTHIRGAPKSSTETKRVPHSLLARRLLYHLHSHPHASPHSHYSYQVPAKNDHHFQRIARRFCRYRSLRACEMVDAHQVLYAMVDLDRHAVLYPGRLRRRFCRSHEGRTQLGHPSYNVDHPRYGRPMSNSSREENHGSRSRSPLATRLE